MITWFDALLVTLIAVTTALGARRGLSGMAWGTSVVVSAFVCNILGIGVVPAVILALILGLASAYSIRQLIPMPMEKPWHAYVGAAGGLVVGALLAATFTLSFPVTVRSTIEGETAVYPSTDMTPALYNAIDKSAIQKSLRRVWTGGAVERALLLPDQAR